MGLAPRQPAQRQLLGRLASYQIYLRKPDRVEEYLQRYPFPIVVEYARPKLKRRPVVYFEDLIPYFEFDQQLRQLLWPWIERVEREVKNRLGALLLQLGKDALINLELYRNSSNYCRSLQILASDLGRRRRGHILNRCPMEGVEFLTFGGMAHWVENLRPRYQKWLARQFQFPRVEQFPSLLHNLRVLRNICAHQGRLWNRQIPISYQVSKPFFHYFDKWAQEQKSDRDLKMRVVHSVVGLEHLVGDPENPQLLVEVEKLRQRYRISLIEIGVGIGISKRRWRELTR